MILALRSFALVGVVTVVAGAQSGRRPPTPPTPVTPPAAPAPAVAPRPVPIPYTPIAPGVYGIDLERALRAAQDGLSLNQSDLRILSQEAAREAAEQARELSRMAIEDSRFATQRALELSREQVQQAMQQSREQQQQSNEASRAAMEDMRLRYAPGLFNQNAFSFSSGPRYQSDPADSLYQAARKLLMNENDYRAAAQRFKEVQQKYPNSRYISEAMYNQAFSLYRAGSDTELREAVTVLEDLQKRYPSFSSSSINSTRSDAATLLQRVRNAQAARGDASARAAVNQAASGDGVRCDSERQGIRLAALSGLSRIDPDAAMNALTQVLAERDRCSLELRRNALQILVSRGDDRAVSTLINTAKSDPSTEMRTQAIDYVVRFPNDEVFSLIESLARSDTNRSVRSAAARGLVGYPSPRARQAVRNIVEDNTVPDDIRRSMLSRYNAERGTAEDATWMRAAYPRVTSPSIRNAIVNAVGRIGGPDSQKWLTDIAANDESATIRSAAFGYVGANMTVRELGVQYDATGSRPMRMQIVDRLLRMRDAEAVDKLFDIVRKGTDDEVKRVIIHRLSSDERASDPKIKAFLAELIGR